MEINLENGAVLLVNKPLLWTSFDVVNKIKISILKLLKEKQSPQNAKKIKIKVGHAGTLDPLATGLLIICIGKETKNIDRYMGYSKEYTGSFYLGATTPSFDKETAKNKTFPIHQLTNKQIYQAAQSLSGCIMQIPPVYSAIKKDGVRAYVNAREGKEVKLDPREITINKFDVTEISLPLVYFTINCSKGTYIRALARDFGLVLNNGAYLNSLCRTKIGDLMLENAQQLDELILNLKLV